MSLFFMKYMYMYDISCRYMYMYMCIQLLTFSLATLCEKGHFPSNLSHIPFRNLYNERSIPIRHCKYNNRDYNTKVFVKGKHMYMYMYM